MKLCSSDNHYTVLKITFKILGKKKLGKKIKEFVNRRCFGKPTSAFPIDRQTKLLMHIRASGKQNFITKNNEKNLIVRHT